MTDNKGTRVTDPLEVTWKAAIYILGDEHTGPSDDCLFMNKGNFKKEHLIEIIQAYEAAKDSCGEATIKGE